MSPATLTLPVRRLRAADEAWAAALLAAAYASDPCLSLPGAPAGCADWLRLLLRYALHAGCVYAAPADQGVAVWLPAGTGALAWGTLLRAGPAAWPRHLDWAGCRRLLHWQQQQETLRQRALPLPNHCLLALGVAPEVQRQGVGRQLLRASLAAVGGRFLPSYAAVYSLRALQFVRQAGFEVAAYGPAAEVAGVAAGAGTCWAMVRAAGSV